LSLRVRSGEEFPRGAIAVLALQDGSHHHARAWSLNDALVRAGWVYEISCVLIPYTERFHMRIRMVLVLLAVLEPLADSNLSSC